MSDQEIVLCNVCRKPIDDKIEAAKDRIYVVRANGKELPVQKKHDACDAEYAKKPGLMKKGS